MTVLTTTDPIRLVQITDTHLYGKAGGTLLKMNTQDSFDQVLELVNATEEGIDFVLATGDIAQDSSPDAYHQFLKQIASLKAPFRWIPGNHDSASVMQQVDPEASGKRVQINNWLILFLDSSIEGHVHGELSRAEMAFLETSLEEAEGDAAIDHCLVCLHHNPVKGNAGWMRDIGLHGGEKFFALIRRFEICRCVVYGHVHQDLDYRHYGIRCLCTPSTCIQFKPHVKNFALDPVSPGFRSLQLHSDGKIDTVVHRVEGFDSTADFQSAGY